MLALRSHVKTHGEMVTQPATPGENNHEIPLYSVVGAEKVSNFISAQTAATSLNALLFFVGWP